MLVRALQVRDDLKQAIDQMIGSPERREWMNEETLLAMETHGGSFVRKLAALYRSADAANREILERAFSHYVVQYEEVAVQVQKNVARGLQEENR